MALEPLRKFAQSQDLAAFPIDREGPREDNPSEGPALDRQGAFIWTAGSCRTSGGEVPEWLKGTDCKSVGFAYAGSNPALSTITPSASVA